MFCCVIAEIYLYTSQISEKSNSQPQNNCCKFIHRIYAFGVNGWIKDRWFWKIFLKRKIFTWIYTSLVQRFYCCKQEICNGDHRNLSVTKYLTTFFFLSLQHCMPPFLLYFIAKISRNYLPICLEISPMTCGCQLFFWLLLLLFVTSELMPWSWFYKCINRKS